MSLAKHESIQNQIKLMPPDGGWGWMVLLGVIIVNVSFNYTFFYIVIIEGNHNVWSQSKDNNIEIIKCLINDYYYLLINTNPHRVGLILLNTNLYK